MNFAAFTLLRQCAFPTVVNQDRSVVDRISSSQFGTPSIKPSDHLRPLGMPIYFIGNQVPEAASGRECFEAWVETCGVFAEAIRREIVRTILPVPPSGKVIGH